MYQVYIYIYIFFLWGGGNICHANFLTIKNITQH